MGGGGKGSSPDVPKPTPVPSYEEEKEPTSKAIRDAESLRIRAKKGHRGNIVTQPLGVKGEAVTGTATTLGVRRAN
jgi:hypothetical protein